MSGVINFEPIVCRFVVVVIGAYLVLDCKVVPSNNKHRPDRQKCTRPRKAQLRSQRKAFWSKFLKDRLVILSALGRISFVRISELRAEKGA